MSPERAAELLPIIEAYSKGQEIEYQRLDGVWVPNEQMGFDGKWNYRVKPAPTYIPWTAADVPLWCWIRRKGANDRILITAVLEGHVMLGGEPSGISFLRLLHEYEYLQGSGSVNIWRPCGKVAP